LQRDHVHEVEGVGRVVDLVVAESEEEPVGDELDVLGIRSVCILAPSIILPTRCLGIGVDLGTNTGMRTWHTRICR
jgi:hypothetical protein